MACGTTGARLTSTSLYIHDEPVRGGEQGKARGLTVLGGILDRDCFAGRATRRGHTFGGVNAEDVFCKSSVNRVKPKPANDPGNGGRLARLSVPQ